MECCRLGLEIFFGIFDNSGNRLRGSALATITAATIEGYGEAIEGLVRLWRGS